MSLAWLLYRAIDIDLEHHPNCDDKMKIIAAFRERPVIERILKHEPFAARVRPDSSALAGIWRS